MRDFTLRLSYLLTIHNTLNLLTFIKLIELKRKPFDLFISIIKYVK